MRRISFMGQVWAPDGTTDNDVLMALGAAAPGKASIIQLDDRTFDDPGHRSAILSLRDVLDRHMDSQFGKPE